MCYWIVHALEILCAADELSSSTTSAIVDFLKRCQDPTGGFCGGPSPGHSPHLAPTYAAVNALLTLGTADAYAAIDRAALRRFLLRMKAPGGAFRMHDDGESDVRGSYCALSIASLCNVLDDEVSRGCGEWIASCQTYEGGIGASPGEEAHGGYTFCGLAALILLGELERLRLPQLTHWLAQQQQTVCGGFQGRTNKLVDGCYSFWQGGSFAMLHAVLSARGELQLGMEADAGAAVDAGAAGDARDAGDARVAGDAGAGGGLFHLQGLLDYLLVCAQCDHGGLRDKPGKGRDYYHTCYGLSGLAGKVSRALPIYVPLPLFPPPFLLAPPISPPPPPISDRGFLLSIPVACLGLPPGSSKMAWADTICTLNPLHNLSARRAEQALQHFAELGPVSE